MKFRKTRIYQQEKVVFLQLSILCSQTNRVWRHKFGYAYAVSGEDIPSMTIFEYCIPLPAEQEGEMLLRNKDASFDRTAYYQRLAMAVQNQYDASKFLSEQNVSSILTFSDVETVRNGATTKIYLATQSVTPIRKSIFDGQTDTLNAIGVLLRLATILRDLSNLNIPFVHRGLDIDEIYMSDDNKILLSGLYYSQWGDRDIVPYLPEKPHNIPQPLLEGEKGDSGSDLYMLACLTWSIFSGCPIGCQLPGGPITYPVYASEDIAQAIQIGLHGQCSDIMAFRKKLTECRKKLVKGEISNISIPLFSKYQTTFVSNNGYNT